MFWNTRIFAQHHSLKMKKRFSKTVREEWEDLHKSNISLTEKKKKKKGKSREVTLQDAVDSEINSTEETGLNVSSQLPSPAAKDLSAPESRLRKVLVRTAMGCCMVLFYCSMLRGGYMYCILVGVLTQVREAV